MFTSDGWMLVRLTIACAASFLVYGWAKDFQRTYGSNPRNTTPAAWALLALILPVTALFIRSSWKPPQLPPRLPPPSLPGAGAWTTPTEPLQPALETGAVAAPVAKHVVLGDTILPSGTPPKAPARRAAGHRARGRGTTGR